MTDRQPLLFEPNEISNIHRSAVFSKCRTWRYTLVREWDHLLPKLLFVLLNPSTADEFQDDRTNRRGIDYALQWGFGSVVFVNLFAIRSPDPDVIRKVRDPIGPGNDRHIIDQWQKADEIVCGWGTKGRYLNRDAEVCAMFGRSLYCLGTNDDGTPKHPLYLKANLKPKPYSHEGITQAVDGGGEDLIYERKKHEGEKDNA